MATESKVVALDLGDGDLPELQGATYIKGDITDHQQVRSVIEEHQPNASRKHELRMLQMVGEFALGKARGTRFGEVEQAFWAAMQAQFFSAGVIPRRLSPSEIVDDSFVKRFYEGNGGTGDA